MKTMKLSRQEYYYLIQKLINKVKKDFVDYKILAISRGGLIPATMISHQTNQSVDVINVFSYTNNKKQADVIIKPFVAYDENMPKKILIVDDLIDSGNTMIAVWKHIIRKTFKNNLTPHEVSIKSVVMIDKNESIIKPDYSAKQTHGPTWISFPYEKE